VNGEPRPAGHRNLLALIVVPVLLLSGVVQVAASVRGAKQPVAEAQPLDSPWFNWMSIWNRPISRESKLQPAKLSSLSPGIRPVLLAEKSPFGESSTLIIDPRGCNAASDAAAERIGVEQLSDALLRANDVVLVDTAQSTYRQLSEVERCDGPVLAVSQATAPESLRLSSGRFGVGNRPHDALGGLIRASDVASRSLGNHVLSVTVPASFRLANRAVWPLGSGTATEAVAVGSLLTLPEGFNTAQLKSPAGQALAQVVMTHGLYVIGNSTSDAIEFSIETGRRSALTEFQAAFGHPFAPPTPCAAACEWQQDVEAVTAALSTVVSNTPETVGGGVGARRVACEAINMVGANLLCGRVTPEARLRQLKVLPLGDSLTAGGESHVSWRIPALELLQADAIRPDFVGSQKDSRSPVDQDHEGHGGFTIGPNTSQFCQRGATCVEVETDLATGIRKWIADANPDVVVLLIGVNDLINTSVIQPDQEGFQRPFDPAGAPNRLAKLVTDIRSEANGPHVVLATLVSSPVVSAEPAFDALRSQVRKLADRDRGITLVDLSSLHLASKDFADPIHLSDSGAELVAFAIVSGLHNAMAVAVTEG
jgi:lysophospholipase L1-like esterase